MENQYTKDNAKATERLVKLVKNLTDDELKLVIYKEGWTIAVMLAHLAFWDRRIAYVLTRWTDGGDPHAELDDDVVNNALEELHKAVEPRAAARLAVESAKGADAAIARVPDAIAAQLIAEDHAYLLRRVNHRTEHIEQIEAGLRG
jgi:uncharacterized damage-inducible protein DinB